MKIKQKLSVVFFAIWISGCVGSLGLIEPLNIPKIKSDEYGCLTNDVKSRMIERDNGYKKYIGQLEAAIR